MLYNVTLLKLAKLSHLASRRVTSRHVTSRHVASRCVTFFLFLCRLILRLILKVELTL